MLSSEEAVSFVQGTLGIPSPLKKVAQDPLKFLEELLPAFQTKIPFQSLTLISIQPDLRRRPTFDEIKDDVMSARGGLCYTLNLFMKYLLEALSFNVQFASASIAGIPDNHLLLIVHNLTKVGDRHLVDVGTGFPFFNAASLDFQDETPVFTNSFIQYKYRYKNGMLIQYLKKNAESLLPPKLEEETDWRQFITSDLIPRDLDYLFKPADIAYMDVDAKFSPFHKSARITGQVGPERRAVAFRDMCLLIENESHILEETRLNSHEEFLGNVNHYFPGLKELAEQVLNTGRIS